MKAESENRTLAEGASYRPQFGRIAKKFFWNSYDHIGKLILASLVSFLLSLTIVGLPMALAGMFGLATQIAAYRDVSFGDFFRLGLKHFGRGLALSAIAIFGGLMLASSLLFYSSDRIGSPLVSLVLLGLTIWILVGFLAWLFVLLPLSFFLNSELRIALRDAAAIVFDNPALSAAHLFLQLALWLAGIATAVGLALLVPGLSAVLAATFTREVLGKYRPGMIDPAEEVRTFADLFRPWQM